MKLLTLEERFFEKVVKGDNPNDCWSWKGRKSEAGYGRIDTKNKGVKRTLTAHRVSYELHHGPIAENMCICHHCDNRECANPQHLFQGTHADNMKDMTEKGRAWRGGKGGNLGGRKFQKGEGHDLAKLKNQDVIEIRRLFATGLSKAAIGRLYGIGES